MAEVIHLELDTSAVTVVAYAKREIETHRGRFCGDAASGTFSVPALTTIAGSYRIIGRNLEIRIARRSLLLSRADIVRYLREELAALQLEQSADLPLPRPAPIFAANAGHSQPVGGWPLSDAAGTPG